MKRKQRKRKWLWVLIPFLALVIGIGIYGWQLASKVASVTNEAHQQLQRGEKSERRINPVYPGKDNFSVLFIGVDERGGETLSRSDVLILATFNKDDKTIKMLHIPRDSRVEIPGYYVDKINHAHFLGGVDLAVDTVEHLFDIPVDYYVKLNFTAFIDIVDALGGVTVEVPFTFQEMDSTDKKNAITLNEGIQTLNGEEALAFVRMRKKDPRGDFGRGDRQKQVIKAIIEKSASLSSITKYDDVLDGIGNNLTMNLTFQNIVALHPYASSLNSIDSLALKGDDTYINRVYYYTLDESSVQEISTTLKQHLGLETVATTQSN
ncbi:LCP family protein [Bacillus kwashiorkori]|uniref:LCP family glycopolymer transferase n=1 Tax=Bacillus kwashiorkori TaxID=1522318 RepID=UPI0030845D71